MYPFFKDSLDSLILCRVFKASGLVEKSKSGSQRNAGISRFVYKLPQEVGMIRVKSAQKQMRHLSSTQDPCRIYVRNLFLFG